MSSRTSSNRKPGRTRERVFAFVRDRLLEGRCPSVREIQHAFGFKAVQTVQQHLDRLVAEGRLLRRPQQARGYALPAASRPVAFVPLLGRIQAGPLTPALENCEGYVAVQHPRADQLFALKVQGKSMIGVGILPGDVAIVRAGPTAESGDVVVALVEDEATVKTLRIRRNRLELHPENPAFPPILPAPGSCTILGKVIEIRRTLAH
jgi:repressor LexA